MNNKITKVLIANRGEIACRIIKTLRKMGIASVAVYSDADSNARHVLLADEACHVGPAPAIESYLNIANIIAAAKATGANAIHPGYGFLSENPLFAEACTANDIIFIGPPASAIRAMGSKSAAKNIMASSGVPLIPGYHGDDQSDDHLFAEAGKIGFPVIIKAALGGGGKGMRVVHNADDFRAALASCRREAMSSFKDDTVLIEKYIGQPRHVEIQVFCDQHGNAVHLFDRDCSIQRRHQKILEEAPAPAIPDTVRQQMASAAIKAAKAINYVGAGTVEFLFDGKDQYYFMEMNTRLQVEHPVTEMITGEDLVEWQVKVAMGEKVPKSQNEIVQSGHAIELRICAEDCRNNFMPSIGSIQILQAPVESDSVRLDIGVKREDTISVYYDPMFAKLIVWGPDRKQCIEELTTRLSELCVAGVSTNADYLFSIIQSNRFNDIELSTHFLSDNSIDISITDTKDAEAAACGYALWHINQHKSESKNVPAVHGWRLNDRQHQIFHLKVNHLGISVDSSHANGVYGIQAGSSRHDIRMQTEGHCILTKGSLTTQQYVFPLGDSVLIFNNGKRFEIFDHLDDSDFDSSSSGERHTAPMPGLVTKIYVETGQQIKRGDPLVAMEAMKMEHVITAHYDGVVASVNCKVGGSISTAEEIIVVEE